MSRRESDQNRKAEVRRKSPTRRISSLSRPPNLSGQNSKLSRQNSKSSPKNPNKNSFDLCEVPKADWIVSPEKAKKIVEKKKRISNDALYGERVICGCYVCIAERWKMDDE